MATRSPTSKHARKVRRKPPDDPVVSTTSSASTPSAYRSAYEAAIASRSSGMPSATVYPRELLCSAFSAAANTAAGAPALGWPAERFTRSPWLRWRSAAASQTSMT